MVVFCVVYIISMMEVRVKYYVVRQVYLGYLEYKM